jgi:23S rRNA-/tRNA-specific pseudouridylate synthase
MSHHVLDVDPEHDGARLDNFLAALVPGQSRSQLQRLIKDG